jgi:hypothetical protein
MTFVAWSARGFGRAYLAGLAPVATATAAATKAPAAATKAPAAATKAAASLVENAAALRKRRDYVIDGAIRKP